MIIKKGNRAELTVSVKDNNGAVVTNLATATRILFMAKVDAQDDNAAAVITKSTPAITVNTPAVGDIRVVILPADTVNLKADKYFIGIQIEYAPDNIQEIFLHEGTEDLNCFELVQDIIR